MPLAGTIPSVRRAATLLAVLAVARSASLAGQEWPTLRGWGLEYISRSGGVQVSLSGQLDVDVLHTTNSWSSMVSLEGGTDVLLSTPEDCSVCHADEPLGSIAGGLAAHRLRLFADIFLGDHVYSLVELRTDRGESPTDGRTRGRVSQAFVRVSTASGGWGAQVGLFASPVGSYASRHLTVADPFLRPPLPYDYRTLMNRTAVPGSADGLLRWRDSPDLFRRPGAPPVWDVPYPWGGMAFGRVAGFDLRVAAVNSSPSSAPDAWGFSWDRLGDPSWVVSARTRPAPGLEVGATWSRGPWMEPLTSGELPAPPPGGAAPDVRDYDQELLTMDLAWSRGGTVVRAEAMLDRWEVPNLARPARERLYSVEAQQDVAAGVFVAGRLGHIDFRPLEGAGPGSTGADWDADVTRLEISLGYRLARNAGLLLSAWDQRQDGLADAEGRLVGMRMWWAF